MSRNTDPKNKTKSVEEKRLQAPDKWRLWGPYLSERQWGTVREDYSEDGSAWDYFNFDQSHFRTYRWGEDGIAGISDINQKICFSLSLWNGKDPYLKEKLFGLANGQGNHGEDVKEYYYYQENIPSHSYMKYLYRYPSKEFPYQELIEKNSNLTNKVTEFELFDTGIFNDNCFFDVEIEYAKADHDDILIKITATNHYHEERPLWLIPTAWYRNTWSWKEDRFKPRIRSVDKNLVQFDHEDLSGYYLYAFQPDEFVFCNNETNFSRLDPNNVQDSHPNRFYKDGISQYLINKDRSKVNSELFGTKTAAVYRNTIPAGQSLSIKLRLAKKRDGLDDEKEFDQIFESRHSEVDEFYSSVCPEVEGEESKELQRQAFAGMLWNKQFYYYHVRDWTNGDSAQPPPPPGRDDNRNQGWKHFRSYHVLSMPDKWEYPWFAAWDTAFHVIPLAMIDPEFAKNQLTLLTREWFMHPNGQIPAYEWAFNDVNPPVHAWSAWRVYKIEQKMYGKADKGFLERVFQKLLLNFTWWVNQTDPDGKNVFQGGFLGLDNIGVFDRSRELPTGGHIIQSDGTSWMAMYCLNMLAIALELAEDNPNYEDIASKFFEHFVLIAESMNNIGEAGVSIWDEKDGFYYDLLHLPDGSAQPLKVQSLVGIIPLFASLTLEPEIFEKFPGFKERMEWFFKYRGENNAWNIESVIRPGAGGRKLLSLVSEERLKRVLTKVLNESEFFSPHGIRSVSRFHKDQPYVFEYDKQTYRVDYSPGESQTDLFGGNSNWRGPIWFPINYLVIESLQRFHHYYGDDLKVECPVESGNFCNLWEVAAELSLRNLSLFLPNQAGRTPINYNHPAMDLDPLWKGKIQFYEFFNGDTGRGLGASHQTGWTGLVAKLIQQCGEYFFKPEE